MEPAMTREHSAEVIELASRSMAAAELIDGLTQRDPDAARAFHRRYGARISRWVWRLLGADAEHDDVVHQVFVNALTAVGGVRDPGALDAWVDSVTIRTVRKEIRARRYRRWLVPATETVEQTVDPGNPARQAHVQRFYRILGQLRPDDRIVLVLRHVEGCTLSEVAAACGCSLATIKRRIIRATEAFRKRAIQDPILVSLLEGGE
jgi:RNA polymerase sigma-70 factor, ECF subfamily